MQMKAVVNMSYGPAEVLQFKEVEKPAPKDDEVLIKVQAVSLNAADWHLLSADIFLIRFMMGFFKPNVNILGADVAGWVEAVGNKVTEFKPGDEVFGDISRYGWGGLAEYACAGESALLLKPACLTFAEAAAVPLAAVTALKGLRDTGEIKPGQKVLINGASGGVGTYAVQFAKALGAEVTAVCSTRNLELARSLGADHVIDYTKEDFTRNGRRYDLILAANGYHPITAYRRALSANGVYVMAGGKAAQMFQALILGPLLSRNPGKKMRSVSSHPDKNDLAFIKELIETGKVKPVVDRRFPFRETVEAFRYLGQGHARGKVVVTME